jgi:hypothetical protein
MQDGFRSCGKSLLLLLPMTGDTLSNCRECPRADEDCGNESSRGAEDWRRDGSGHDCADDPGGDRIRKINPIPNPSPLGPIGPERIECDLPASVITSAAAFPAPHCGLLPQSLQTDKKP